MKQPLQAFGRDLELRQIDPVRRRARRYRIAKCGSLFGESALLITWGRIGGPLRVRLETFSSAAELEARWQELLARRSAHGYVVAADPGEGLRAARAAA